MKHYKRFSLKIRMVSGEMHYVSDRAHETEEDLATTLRVLVHYVPEAKGMRHLYIATERIESFQIVEDRTV